MTGPRARTISEVEEIVDALVQTGLFGRWTRSRVREVVEVAVPMSFQPEEAVFVEGSRADSMYFVLSGKLQLYAGHTSSSEMLLATFGPREIVGEQALFPGHPGRRTASARAVLASEVLRFGKDDFLQTLGEDTTMRTHLLRVGSRTLREQLTRRARLVHVLGLGDGEELVERWIASGDVIFDRGDPAGELYLILDGEVEVEDERTERRILGRDQLLGEQDVLQATGRSCRAWGKTRTRLLVIPGQRFSVLRERSLELREHLRTLRRVYKRAGFGVVSQYSGQFMGKECVTTLYALPTGHRWVASRVIGDELFHLERVTQARGVALTTFGFCQDGVDRELRLADDGSILGLTAHGPWPGLHELHDAALEGRPLGEEHRREFERRGTVTFERSATQAGDHDRLCRCTGVKRGVVRRAIARDCRSIPELQARFGCGTVCGGCLPLLRDLVDNPAWQLVTLGDEVRHSGRVRSFRLDPMHGRLEPALPGQYVVVRARVDDHWVERPLFVTSYCEESGGYEVLLRRRTEGMFSNWMFHFASEDSLMCVSRPRGAPDVLDDPRPLVCLVEGIGVARAVWTIRNAPAGSRAVVLDCSLSDPEDRAFEDELEGLAEQSPRVDVRVRVAGSDPALGRSDVRDLCRSHPAACFIVCGGDAYRHRVVACLSGEGVGSDRVEEVSLGLSERPSSTRPGLVGRVARWLGLA